MGQVPARDSRTLSTGVVDPSSSADRAGLALTLRPALSHGREAGLSVTFSLMQGVEGGVQPNMLKPWNETLK